MTMQTSPSPGKSQGESRGKFPGEIPGESSAPDRGARRKRLLFHIGDRKTGSTAIQAAFAAGRVRFADRSVLYPADMAHNYLVGIFAQGAETGLPGPDLPGRPNLVTLPDMIRKADSDFVLLSAENFESMDPRLFHRVVQDRFAGCADEIRVVRYLRPHAPRLLSSFAERLKLGARLQHPGALLDRAMKEGFLAYAPALRGFRDLFGADFIARPLIRSELANGSVLDDLVLTGFGDIAYEVAPGPAANESLCIEDLLLLRHLQTRFQDRRFPLRMGLGWVIGLLLAARPRPGGGTKPRLHKALAERIRTACLEDARAVDAEFMGGRALFVPELDKAVETALPRRQSWRAEDYFTPGELRDMAVLVEAVALMLGSGQTEMDWVETLRGLQRDLMIAPVPDPASGPASGRAGAPEGKP